MSASRPLIRHSGIMDSGHINALLSPPTSPSEQDPHAYSTTSLLVQEFDMAPFSESFFDFLDGDGKEVNEKDGPASPTDTGLATPADTVCSITGPDEPERLRPLSIAASLRADASYYVEHLTDIRGVDSDWDDDEIEEVMVITKHKHKRPRSSTIGSTAPITGSLSDNTTSQFPSDTPSSNETTPTLTPSTSLSDNAINIVRTYTFPTPTSVRRELECLKLLAQSCSSSRTQFLQTMHACWEDEKGLNMAFEKPEFGSLLDCLRGVEDDSLVVEKWQTKIWACEIAHGIESLHSLGVVHCSVRPSHIFINGDGHALVGGFERSVILAEQADDKSPTLVRSGGSNPRNSIISVIGDQSPREDDIERQWEEAPEMLLGWEHGPEVDWWSYGLILGWMACGQHPLFDRNERVDAETMRRRITRGQMRVAALLGVEPELQDLIQKCLERNPAKRIDYEGIKKHAVFTDLDWEYVVLQGQAGPATDTQTPELSGTPSSRVTLASPFDESQNPSMSLRNTMRRHSQATSYSHSIYNDIETSSIKTDLDALSNHADYSPVTAARFDSHSRRSHRDSQYSALAHSPGMDSAENETATLGFAQRLSLTAVARPVSIAISRPSSTVDAVIPEEDGDELEAEVNTSLSTIRDSRRPLSQGYEYPDSPIRPTFATWNGMHRRSGGLRVSFAPTPSIIRTARSNRALPFNEEMEEAVSEDFLDDGHHAVDQGHEEWNNRILRHSNSTTTTFGREVDARPMNPEPRSPSSAGVDNLPELFDQTDGLEAGTNAMEAESSFSMYLAGQLTFEDSVSNILGTRMSKSRTGRGSESAELGVDEFGVWIDSDDEDAGCTEEVSEPFRLEGEVAGEDTMSLEGALALSIPILVDNTRRATPDEDTITQKNIHQRTRAVKVDAPLKEEFTATSRSGTIDRLKARLKKKRRETMLVVDPASDSEDEADGQPGNRRALVQDDLIEPPTPTGSAYAGPDVRRTRPRSSSVPMLSPLTTSGSLGFRSDVSLPEIAWHGNNTEENTEHPSPSPTHRGAHFANDADTDEEDAQATPRADNRTRTARRPYSSVTARVISSTSTFQSSDSRPTSYASASVSEVDLGEKRQDERIRADETFRWSALSLDVLESTNAQTGEQHSTAPYATRDTGSASRVTWSVYGLREARPSGRRGSIVADSSIKTQGGGGGGASVPLVKKMLKKINKGNSDAGATTTDCVSQELYGGGEANARPRSSALSLRLRLGGSLRSSASSATISAGGGSRSNSGLGSSSSDTDAQPNDSETEGDRTRREGWVRSSAFVASLGSLGMGAGMRRMGRGIGYNAAKRNATVGPGGRSSVATDVQEDEIVGCYSGLWRRDVGASGSGMPGTKVRVSREVKVEEEEEEEEVIDVRAPIAAGCD